MHKILIISTILLTFGLIACKQKPSDQQQQTRASLSANTTSATQRLIQLRAKQAIEAIRDQDMNTLAQLAHPEKGITFSPEVQVLHGQQAFSADDLAMVLEKDSTYFWGLEDGSGDSIQASFSDYYERYLYDKDFAAADSVVYNRDVQRGNTINNARRAYQEGVIVEYYIPGSEVASGMDWGALRLVFEESAGNWYLVGIIHAAWTI